mmetsp:Transcript_43976/g.125403  ORF Transcript_43976/g.125403 Transcript_43976/m.125403 type:complete len:229 (+) Transcript_43976:621-1307(+)
MLWTNWCWLRSTDSGSMAQQPRGYPSPLKGARPRDVTDQRDLVWHDRLGRQSVPSPSSRSRCLLGLHPAGKCCTCECIHQGKTARGFHGCTATWVKAHAEAAYLALLWLLQATLREDGCYKVPHQALAPGQRASQLAESPKGLERQPQQPPALDGLDKADPLGSIHTRRRVHVRCERCDMHRGTAWVRDNSCACRWHGARGQPSLGKRQRALGRGALRSRGCVDICGA